MIILHLSSVQSYTLSKALCVQGSSSALLRSDGFEKHFEKGAVKSCAINLYMRRIETIPTSPSWTLDRLDISSKLSYDKLGMSR